MLPFHVVTKLLSYRRRRNSKRHSFPLIVFLFETFLAFIAVKLRDFFTAEFRLMENFVVSLGEENMLCA